MYDLEIIFCYDSMLRKSNRNTLILKYWSNYITRMKNIKFSNSFAFHRYIQSIIYFVQCI